MTNKEKYAEDLYSIFLGSFGVDEENKTDWSKVLVDTPILVKDELAPKWIHRHFAKYENGKVFAWANGPTSWSARDSVCVDWECARLCEDNK